MKGSELKRILRKAGCRKVGEGANHERWINPANGKNFWVPRHDAKEINGRTCRAILTQAGINS